MVPTVCFRMRRAREMLTDEMEEDESENLDENRWGENGKDILQKL
jgi:hypothetical protein